MRTSSRPAGKSGLLAGLFGALICGQGLAQSGCLDTTKTRLELAEQRRSEESFNCSYTLFPAAGTTAATPAPAIDYCKQLIIVDPAIIANMPQLEFKPMLARLFGPDMDGVVKAWIKSWAEGDGESSRNGIQTAMEQAWKTRIKPIAVVNRLDLALNPDILWGEGRIVYQMFTEAGRPMDMTLILEFDYPQLGGETDPMANARAWAGIWQGLAVPTDAAQFRCALDDVVRNFAQRDNLQRIRTNEKLVPGPWAFREFTFKDCDKAADQACVPRLEWNVLPGTPRDGYRHDPDAGDTAPDAVNKHTLSRYLQHGAVFEALKAGNHRFGNDYGLLPPATIQLDPSAETGDHVTWIRRESATDEARLLMSLGSCNGCHTDFKPTHDTLPHIHMSLERKFPILSQFLTAPIDNLHFPLPGCSRVSGKPDTPDTARLPVYGCQGKKDGKYYIWDERLHRVQFLENLLKESFIEDLLPTPQLQYRYH